MMILTKKKKNLLSSKKKKIAFMFAWFNLNSWNSAYSAPVKGDSLVLFLANPTFKLLLHMVFCTE